jgi:rRNA maturation protein Rpf1
MSIAELSSRIKQSRASAAIVVSLFKGNPRSLQILSPDGGQIMEVRVESAKLRREVTSSHSPKMRNIHSIAVQSEAGEQTRAIAEMLSSLLDAPIAESLEIVAVGSKGMNEVMVWLQDFPTGKTLWTFYHAKDGLEIGPRMRITSVNV